MGTQTQNLLQATKVSVRYGDVLRAVCGATFSVQAGEAVGLLGESGCGKSTLARAVLGLLPAHTTVEGSILFRGRDLLSASTGQLRELRGAQVALVAQDPAQSLNPVLTIGTQVSEVLRSHTSLSRKERRGRTLEVLASVGFKEPHAIARRYAHQLSGGERQRAAIAQAIACRPSLLVADEATSKLDARLKVELLELFQELRTNYGMALLLITHEPSVASYCDQLLIMYAGEIVESGAKDSVLRQPLHPYSQALLDLARQRSLRRDTSRLTRFATIDGEPQGATPSNRCFFEGRCNQQMPDCSVRHPVPTLHAGHEVLCLKYE